MKIIAIILLLLSSAAEARVFNINESSMATYFKGSLGTSNIKKDPFEDSSGAQTVDFSAGSDYNWGGEIGFAIPSKDYSFRFGIEMIAPHISSDNKGNNSSDTTLMSIDSSVLAYFAVAHMEYYVMKNNWGRVYLSFGGGYGKVSLKNSYVLTTDGDAAYSTSNSFEEKSSQYAYLIETAVGYETSFTQTVTVSFDLGYRYSTAGNLKYNGAGEDFGGGHAAGDDVLDADGKKRVLDLGGVFTGLSFRFYFN